MKNKNISLLWVVAILLCLSSSTFAQTASGTDNIKAEYDKLKKELKSIKTDRDNLMSQMKILLKYKSESVSIEQKETKIKLDRGKWEIEKKLLKSENQNLKNEVASLRVQVEESMLMQIRAEEEKDEVRKSLSKSKAGYIIIDDLKRKVRDEKHRNKSLNKGLKRFQKKINKMLAEKGKAETTEEVLRGQISELKLQYKEAQKRNKLLANKLQQQPRQYAEMARENKVLLKRTALMHYNLGVFYTKGKEYERAISEFEKAVELNPEDTYSYFNLGYIYAEHYEERHKAINNFRKYLTLARKDDKDVDWVKRYILTWETWEGKKITK